jgi:hypothetical protein
MNWPPSVRNAATSAIVIFPAVTALVATPLPLVVRLLPPMLKPTPACTLPWHSSK